MDITLTMKQQKRIEIIERALRNDLTVVEAAMVSGVSERQCYRVKARLRDQGVKGVLHGNRGRPEAQAVWENYLPKFNRTFSKTARKTQPAWRKVHPYQLEQSLCFKYQRTVADDHTVNFEGALFQITKKVPARSYAGKRINVHVLLDGSVEFFFKEQRIARFDFKTACASGLYRTNSKRQMFRYGPLTRSLNQPHDLSP